MRMWPHLISNSAVKHINVKCQEATSQVPHNKRHQRFVGIAILKCNHTFLHPPLAFHSEKNLLYCWCCCYECLLTNHSIPFVKIYTIRLEIYIRFVSMMMISSNIHTNVSLCFQSRCRQRFEFGGTLPTAESLWGPFRSGRSWAGPLVDSSALCLHFFYGWCVVQCV